MCKRTSHLPNFFLVGAPKTGTTSLYHHLRQHPDVYLSPVKEPCFFASEMRAANFDREFANAMERSSRRLLKYLNGPMTGPNPGGVVDDWNDYIKLFKNAHGEKAVGEASVCYLWSPTAARNIHARFPHAKIVAILRDPVERAFSQYLQYAAGGMLKRSFRQHIELCLRSGAAAFGQFRPFLEYGLYHEQVKRYRDLFSPANFRVYFYEEAWRSPAHFLADLFGFLGADSSFVVDTSMKDLQGRAPRAMTIHYALRKWGGRHLIKRLFPGKLRSRLRPVLFQEKGKLRLDAREREFTLDYYRSDIQKLSGLLDRDLSAWLR